MPMSRAKVDTFQRPCSFPALHGIIPGVLLAWAGLGCAGAREPARSNTQPNPPVNVARAQPRPQSSARPTPEPTASPTPAPVEEERLTREIPSECAPGAPGCNAPAGFVESTCRSKYPELALVLFAKGTPWQRAYVKAEQVEPVNVYGGERSDRWLYFGEEVLILRERGGTTDKIRVSGPTDVDILRWDGTCATIRKEMLVSYVTAPMKSVRILWRYLDTSFQEALARDELVRRAELAERRDCRGSSVRNPSDSCDKVMKKLTDTIVLAVKQGAELPTPATVPAWKRP